MVTLLVQVEVTSLGHARTIPVDICPHSCQTTFKLSDTSDVLVLVVATFYTISVFGAPTSHPFADRVAFSVLELFMPSLI